MQNTPATSSTAPRIRQAVRTANAKTAPPALAPRPAFARAEPRRVMAACRLRYRAASQCRAGLRRGRALWPWPAAGLRQYICPCRRAGLPGRAAIVPAAGYRLEAGGGLHRGADRPHCGPPAGPDRLFARRGLRGGRSAVGTGACHPGGRRKPADTASLLCSAALAVLVGLGIHKLHIGTPRGVCLWAAMAAACLQRAAPARGLHRGWRGRRSAFCAVPAQAAWSTPPYWLLCLPWP